MTTKIEFKRGVLFVRINGLFVSSSINDFENEVIPIILGLGVKNITINLYEVSLIDKMAIESIIKVSNVANKIDGKVVICEINDNIRDIINDSDIFDYCYKSKNELTSLGVF